MKNTNTKKIMHLVLNIRDKITVCGRTAEKRMVGHTVKKFMISTQYNRGTCRFCLSQYYNKLEKAEEIVSVIHH